jgi:hypothetical protein
MEQTDWQQRALKLWIGRKTVREIAEECDQPIDDVAAFLGRRTQEAVFGIMDDRLRSGGYK